MLSRMLRALLQGGFPAPVRWKLESASASPLCLLRRSTVSGRLTTQRRHCSQALSGSVLKVCVIGSGPAGFYTAHQLVKVGFAADVCVRKIAPIKGLKLDGRGYTTPKIILNMRSSGG